MSNVRTIATEIVTREGGFVNDPDDPGGATKYGVTIGTLRHLGRDLDGDGDIDVADIHRLTKDEARDIFVRHYFERPGIDGLPELLHDTVFDMYVNAGRNAVKILQRLLTEMGQPCTVDGVIGPQTRAAAAAARKAAPRHLRDAYGIARRDYYYGLGDRNARLRKFARRRDGGKGGWITRAEAFIARRFHLTDAEHRARVASWG